MLKNEPNAYEAQKLLGECYTEKFKSVSKRKPTSTAPAAVATSRKTQQPLEAFFLPPERIPPDPN